MNYMAHERVENKEGSNNSMEQSSVSSTKWKTKSFEIYTFTVSGNDFNRN